MTHQESSELIQFEELSTVHINLNYQSINGRILDIGGGGEGVIGQWLPQQVTAIDNNIDELTDSADGPIKIVMDAQHLLFVDKIFDNCTLFYTLMFMPSRIQEKAVEEIFRILKPGGNCYVWDVNFPKQHNMAKPYYLIRLRITILDRLIQTGYGANKPETNNNAGYFCSLFEKYGFQRKTLDESNTDHFFAVFHKPLLEYKI